MTRTVYVALALAGALLTLGCSSRPAPRPEPGGRAGDFAGGLIAAPISLAMVDFDADGDRATALAELDAGVEIAWRELDANGDGDASPIEFADWSRAVFGSDTAIPGRLAFDRDANGAISRTEFAAAMTGEFDRLDANNDGAVERAELVRLVDRPTVGMSRGVRRELGDPEGQRPPGGPGGQADEESDAQAAAR